MTVGNRSCDPFSAASAIRRHINITAKNRARIVSGIADMVQKRWLTPGVIREHPAGFSASKQLLDCLSEETQAEAILSFLRDLFRKLCGGNDRQRFQDSSRGLSRTSWISLNLPALLAMDGGCNSSRGSPSCLGKRSVLAGGGRTRAGTSGGGGIRSPFLRRNSMFLSHYGGVISAPSSILFSRSAMTRAFW